MPEAVVDYLVFKGTEGVLAKNPCVRNVHTIQPGEKGIAAAFRLFRRYDVALAAGSSDRMAIFSILAGRQNAALLHHKPKEWWKKLLLSSHAHYEDTRHVVWNLLSLLKPFGIAPCPRIVIGFDDDDRRFVQGRLPQKDFILLHPYSRASYKMWPLPFWAQLARMLEEQLGIQAVFTVTPAPEDRAILQAIEGHAGHSIRTIGDPFSLNQMACALSLSRAYIGIDTVVTHIAAAVGTPTFAIFGPTLTRYWAPWPAFGAQNDSPFCRNRGVQQVGNVTIVQQDWDCASCNDEVCRLNSDGSIACLKGISPEDLLGVVKSSLVAGGNRGA